MLFGVWTWVAPKNHVLVGGPGSAWDGAILGVVLSHWKCIATARASKTAIY